ncbi:MAG: HIT domain-containing protein [archaeon]|nr:HIT domain-containing protein [archaeon]
MAQLTPEQMAQLQQLPPEQRAQIEQKLAAQGNDMQQPVECIFCKIAKGEVPSKIVAQNDECIAFLDIQPKAAGHTVIITKDHKATLMDLSQTQKASIQQMQESIISRMMSSLKATGYIIINPNGISAGQMMPHFALHIIPTYGSAPDLPVMNVIQTTKVPDFVNDAVFSALQNVNSEPAQTAEKKDDFYF